MYIESRKHARRRRRSGSIRSRRRGCWEVRVPLPPDPATGRRRQRSITVHGNRRTAEAELRCLGDKVFPSPGSRQGTTLALARLLDVWWEAKQTTLAASTAREYQRIIDTRLKPDLGAKHLDRLSPFHLDAYYYRLRGEGLRPGSIRQIHAVLRGALGQAHRWGWLPTNPAAATRPPRRRKPTIDPPSPDQTRRLLATAAQVSKQFGLFVRLAAVLGARRGELCGLRWTDFDFDTRTLTIRTGIADVAGRLVETDTKSHKPRTISLDADTARRLRGHRRWAERTAVSHKTALDERAFVLSEAPHGATPYRPDKATGTFRRVAKRAGLPRTRLHDLRHFAATQLIGAGCDLRTVAGRLGHGQPWTTLNTYAAFLHERDQAAADELASLLEDPANSDRRSTSSKLSRRSS